eukprot:328561_1
MCLFIFYYIVICIKLYQLHNTQITQQYQQHQMKVKANNHNTMEQNCFVNICKVLFYISLYLTGIMFIVLYVIYGSLPADNILYFSETTAELIKHSIAFILAINNSYVVPNLVHYIIHSVPKLKGSNTYTFMIVLLRSFNLIIVPILSSIFLLNDCGKYWTLFWQKCLNHSFDINIEIDFQISNAFMTTPVIPFTFDILTNNAVCKPNSIYSINWNRCLRSFYSNWSQVIMLKIIISIFLPICTILYQILKRIAYKYLYLTCNKSTIFKLKDTITIDREYGMIITNLEQTILFALISPFIIPISILSLESRKLFYYIMKTKLKWKIIGYDERGSNIIFPFQFLVFSIMCSQILIGLFFIFCIQFQYVSIFWTLSALIDILFI